MVTYGLKQVADKVSMGYSGDPKISRRVKDDLGKVFEEEAGLFVNMMVFPLFPVGDHATNPNDYPSTATGKLLTRATHPTPFCSSCASTPTHFSTRESLIRCPTTMFAAMLPQRNQGCCGTKAEGSSDDEKAKDSDI